MALQASSFLDPSDLPASQGGGKAVIKVWCMPLDKIHRWEAVGVGDDNVLKNSVGPG